MDLAERALPHSLDAERSVLGAILVDEAALSLATTAIAPEDFFRDAHGRLFRAMGRLASRGVAIDFITLKDELQRAGELDEVGGPAYIASLADGVPRATNVEHYARIVKEKAVLRGVIAASNLALAAAYEAEDGPAAIVDAALKRLSAITTASADGLVAAHAAIAEYAAAVDGDGLGTPVCTGYADLDELTGGFKPSDLVVVAARPSVGKTSFAVGAADAVAAHGQTAVIFSLETGRYGLAGRLLSSRAHVSMAKMARREASVAEYARISDELAREPVPLWIETSARTVAEIGAWCRRIADRGQLALAVVDYLQLLLPDRRRDSDEAEIKEISRALKRLAQDLNIVVMALSQLSRAPEARRDKRPTLADLRGSGALEQDADVALLLFRPEMYDASGDQAGIAEVIVAKQRNGPTGVVRLAFLAEYTKFANLAVG